MRLGGAGTTHRFSRCGRVVESPAGYCPRCGAAFAARQQRRRPALARGIFGVALLAAGMLYALRTAHTTPQSGQPLSAEEVATLEITGYGQGPQPTPGSVH